MEVDVVDAHEVGPTYPEKFSTIGSVVSYTKYRKMFWRFKLDLTLLIKFRAFGKRPKHKRWVRIIVEEKVC